MENLREYLDVEVFLKVYLNLNVLTAQESVKVSSAIVNIFEVILVRIGYRHVFL